MGIAEQGFGVTVDVVVDVGVVLVVAVLVVTGSVEAGCSFEPPQCVRRPSPMRESVIHSRICTSSFEVFSMARKTARRCEKNVKLR